MQYKNKKQIIAKLPLQQSVLTNLMNVQTGFIRVGQAQDTRFEEN